MKVIHLLKILTITLFIISCDLGDSRISTADSDLHINIQRLEVDLFLNQDNVNGIKFDRFEQIKTNYGPFFKLYLENIIAVGNYEDSATIYYLNRFLTDLQIKEVADVTLEIYPNINDLENEITDAFIRYQKLFPDKSIPAVYTYVSGFSYPMVVDSTILGIGLDFYLGRDQDYYRLLGLPVYKTRNLNRENIVADAMKSWLATEFELKSENSDLVSNMIYHGKILYAMDLLLPDVEDSIKIGYSSRDMDWVKKHEKDIWFHFAESDLLYNKQGKQIQKYIGEAPFTPGFPEGSPGMVGRWVGWQIVRKFMNNTEPLNVKALFKNGDAQKILKISKYKPI